MFAKLIVSFFNSIAQMISAPFESLSTAMLSLADAIPAKAAAPTFGEVVSGALSAIVLGLVKFFADLVMAIGALLANPAVIALLVSAVVFAFVGWCLLHRKVGLPWESMFVPVYNLVSMYSVADCDVIFWINLILAVIFLPINALPALIIVLILTHIIFFLNLAKCFGKGTLFAIGLIVLHPIFIFILALDDSKYIFGSARKKD